MISARISLESEVVAGSPTGNEEKRFAEQTEASFTQMSKREDTPATAVAEPDFNDLPSLHRFPKWSKWVSASICFLSGVFSAYAFKIQNKQAVKQCEDIYDSTCAPKEFVGAFLQTLLMFIAETLCLGIWYADEAFNKRKKKVPWSDFTISHKSFVKPEGHWWGWIIPSCLDNAATICANIAMTLTYASTVQMLRNFLVVICAVLQLGLIRRALRVHEWIGVITITLAMVLTAIPAVLMPEKSTSNDGGKAWLGIVLAICGTSMQGMQIIFEEWLFKKWRYSPCKAVGVEGITGIIVVACVMPIAQVTGLENVKLSFYQFFHSWQIGLVTVFYIAACVLFNAAGLATTKLGGGLLRSIIFALRAPAVWILDLIVSWISFDYYNLAAIFVFLTGFAIHVRLYPHSRLPKFHKIMSRPWHWWCTNRELDEDYDPTQEPLKTRSSTHTSISSVPSFDPRDYASPHYFPPWTKWVAAVLTFVCGTFCAYAFKWHNKVDVARCGDSTNPDCSEAAFVGAFWQTFLMFFAESCSLIIWYIDSRINIKKNKVTYTDFTISTKSFVKPEAKWWYWIIPSMMDNLGTLFCNIGYTLTYASTVQMLRNFLVVVCAMLQLICLRRALRIHEWIGVVLITGAMALTATPAILNPEDGDKDISKSWLGIIMALLGTSCQGVQFVFEEWVYKRYRYSPVKTVGVEGVVGLVTISLMMVVAHYAGFEDQRVALYQFFHSTKIMVITVFYLFSCIVFNGAGQATTKLGSALLKSIIFAMRGPAVWLLDLANRWIAFDYYNLAGIFVFLIGFVIYARCYPPEKFPKLHKFLSKPWHWCCTNRKLDEDYVAAKNAKQDAKLAAKLQESYIPIHDRPPQHHESKKLEVVTSDQEMVHHATSLGTSSGKSSRNVKELV